MPVPVPVAVVVDRHLAPKPSKANNLTRSFPSLSVPPAPQFGNYITAATFAHRLLELPDMASERNAELRGKAQKVLQKSEQMARNEHAIDYDDRQAFTLDCRGLTPIYKVRSIGLVLVLGSLVHRFEHAHTDRHPLTIPHPT